MPGPLQGGIGSTSEVPTPAHPGFYGFGMPGGVIPAALWLRGQALGVPAPHSLGAGAGQVMSVKYDTSTLNMPTLTQSILEVYLDVTGVGTDPDTLLSEKLGG